MWKICFVLCFPYLSLFHLNEEVAKSDSILIFYAVGGTGIQDNCHTLYAGKLYVNWCLDDGLALPNPESLPASFEGNVIHYTDIAGYRALHTMKCNKELFQADRNSCIYSYCTYS